jgi:hypothetical protein
MAQTTCQKCGYPFATSFKCSNCGQYPKNVKLTANEKAFSYKIIGFIVVISVLFGILTALGFDSDNFALILIIGIIIIIWNFVKKGNRK